MLKPGVVEQQWRAYEASGLTVWAFARTHGLPGGTLYARFRTRGLPIFRERGFKRALLTPPEEVFQLRSLRTRGWTLQRIALCYGVSKQAIRQRLAYWAGR